MTSRSEDVIGQAIIIWVFSFFALAHVASIVSITADPGSVNDWELALVSRAFSLIFLLLVVYLTVTRLPPKNSVEGIEPRVSSIAGTSILMLLIVLPTGNVGPGLRYVAMLLIVTGTLFSIYCLSWLGRSFSVMATARRLVTNGPYSIVRHPLYLAESITVVGILISNWSVSALFICAAQVVLQFRRMFNEEKILASTFPDYNEYGDRIPMFIPFIPPSRLAFRHTRVGNDNADAKP